MSPILSTLAGASVRVLGFLASAGGLPGFLGYFSDSLAAASQQDYLFANTIDASSNMYATGYYLASAGNTVGIVGKTDTQGALLWQRSITDTQATHNTRMYSIKSDSSANVFAAGYGPMSASYFGGIVAKYNSSGTIQWQRTLDNLANNSPVQFYSSAIDSSGNTYVVGSGYSTPMYRGLIAKYNTSGVIQWQSYINLTNRGGLNAAVCDSSGNLYVSGSGQNASAGTNALIAKYTSAGALSWSRSLNDGLAAASQNDGGSAIAVDSSANVYVGGYFLNASSGMNGYLAKYDTSGTLLWQRTLADSNAAASQSTAINYIWVDSSGNVFVCGGFKNASGGSSGFIAKYNSSGAIQWQRSLADANAAASQTTSPNGLTGDNVLNLYVTGYFKNTSAGFNALAMKIALDGSKLGTFSVDASHSITIAASTLTDAAGSLTSATAGTSGTPTWTDSAGAFTDAAGAATYTKASI
jgi:hypothetical protein